MKEILLGSGSVKEEIGDVFLGEVPASEFITGDALASAIGLTAGTAQHSNEPWLKFLDPVDGKTKYFAKKPFRHSLSWNNINARGAIFGTITVKIQDNTYKVRVANGATVDEVPNQGGQTPTWSRGSEWNRLLYPIVSQTYGLPSSGISPDGYIFGSWASYSDADLGVERAVGLGRYNFCMERGRVNVVTRGDGLTYGAAAYGPTSSSSIFGWRPVLELVE